MTTTNLHLLWRGRSPLQRFRTGVSLHSHTMHSHESMGFVPRYTAGVPLLAPAIRQQERRYAASTGRPLDFSKAYWTPPLAPREAYDLEKKQIERDLHVEALVSLTDHDDIEAGSLLSVVEQARPIPISLEWTVPFGPSFFHIGVHNLPPQRARSMMADLAAYTSLPSRPRLGELLTALDELDETLLVFNHPLWDESGIGAVEHAQLLGAFLESYGDRIHALELNGLRPWKENAAVRWVAQHSGHPLISGGDRHGCEPNANLNLTNTATFAEFVAEIRQDKMSDVLFMPQYREPLQLRVIETIWDIVREYPERAVGRRRWSDRVFYQLGNGSVQPLSALWKGDGRWPVQYFLQGLRILKSQQLRGALRFAFAGTQEVYR
jgi:hypothetical protein